MVSYLLPLGEVLSGTQFALVAENGLFSKFECVGGGKLHMHFPIGPSLPRKEALCCSFDY